MLLEVFEVVYDIFVSVGFIPRHASVYGCLYTTVLVFVFRELFLFVVLDSERPLETSGLNQNSLINGIGKVGLPGETQV